MSCKDMTRRSFLKGTGVGALAAALPAGANAAGTGAAKPNVLFICVDDLRPQLPCYGKDFMVTPNLDRLAARSAVFENHFVQVPTCGASRCSLLTGHRPHTPERLSNTAFQSLPRTDPGHPIAMPHFFQQHGYKTASIGKVTHTPTGRRYGKPARKVNGETILSGPDDHEPELALGWDQVGGPTGEWGNPWSAFFAYAGGKTRSYIAEKTPATEAADVPDTGYPDGLIAEEAVKQLRQLKDEPFFLSVGFYKPHLPFCAPKKYWDLYEREAIPLPAHPQAPENVDPKLSLHRNGELTGRYAALGDPIEATEAETRLLRHGYFACVSYVDAQIGKVLDELEQLGLSDNTIVVVWGDHGWHLGDLHVWGKHTTFEFSLRSTLVVRVPGKAANGSRVGGLVESLDLYPTLAAACGLEAPGDLHGTSLLPMLDNPKHPGKDGAFGYWRRGSHTARTIRTPRYRLVEWKSARGRTAQLELYDHQSDPDETINIAKKSPETVAHLLEQLHAESPRLREPVG